MYRSMSSRCSSSNNPYQNQSLFIRGFRIAMRRKVFFGRLEVEVKSTDGVSPEELFSKRGGNLPFGRSHTASSGSSSGLEMSSSSSASRSFSSSQQVLSTVSETSNDGNDSEDTEEPRIKMCFAGTCERVFPLLTQVDQLYHPLNYINQYILNSNEDIEVVITHDNDWISVLRNEDIEMPGGCAYLDRLIQSDIVEGHADPVAASPETGHGEIRPNAKRSSDIEDKVVEGHGKDKGDDDKDRSRLYLLENVGKGIIRTTDSKKELTILLLRETGVGKTALLSFIGNVLAGHKVDRYIDLHEPSIEMGGPQSQSQTDAATLYEFVSQNDVVVRILDTPGLADTRGVVVDDRHRRGHTGPCRCCQRCPHPRQWHPASAWCCN
ncbi:hypothetical protein L218DRAFT_621119 [Marasmius fiardii PR-910]|nr:hypothetical protein L218DRAFT_621119 [Marasmius fiardii PR-910]